MIVSPQNGGSPHTISKSTQPSDHQSTSKPYLLLLWGLLLLCGICICPCCCWGDPERPPVDLKTVSVVVVVGYMYLSVLLLWDRSRSSSVRLQLFLILLPMGCSCCCCGVYALCGGEVVLLLCARLAHPNLRREIHRRAAEGVRRVALLHREKYT